MGVGGFSHGTERLELGIDLGLAELFAELVVRMAFAMNRAEGAANVAGRVGERAAGGNEGTDFAALGVVEGAGTAGLGRGGGHWRNAEWGVGSGEFGSRIAGFVHLYSMRGMRIAEVVAKSKEKILIGEERGYGL